MPGNVRSARMRETGSVALTTDQWVPAPHDHVVQFYAHDDELADSVGRYLSDTIESGGVAIVIGTESHLRAFTSRLGEVGIDVAQAREAGAPVLLVPAVAMASFFLRGRSARPR